LLRRLIGEDIEFQTTLTDKELTVMADSGQMEQVWMNLATNARDSMPKGGRLTIRSELIELDKLFKDLHGYGVPGMYALVSIADTGIGMDKKTAEKIFEPFFTTKEMGRGTGLGLAIVYGIIKQHNGYINVYSEPDKGTTFNIYIPVISAKSSAGEATVLAPPLTGGTETILAAEDDTALKKLTETVLNAYGYRTIMAEDGEDAVKKFIEHKDRIQLVILDMIMPKKSGKEAYDEIRKIKPGIKTLFVSGYTADKMQQEGTIEEGIELMLKPVSPKDLLRKVREVLDR
jgi:CheY-like chemotaxis protein